MKNPIYLEYYSPENEYCYKLKLPYSDNIVVLSRLEDGADFAKRIALSVLIENIQQALAEPILKQ